MSEKNKQAGLRARVRNAARQMTTDRAIRIAVMSLEHLASEAAAEYGHKDVVRVEAAAAAVILRRQLDNGR